jgi:hypothetical protein
MAGRDVEPAKQERRGRPDMNSATDAAGATGSNVTPQTGGELTRAKAVRRVRSMANLFQPQRDYSHSDRPMCGSDPDYLWNLWPEV